MKKNSKIEATSKSVAAPVTSKKPAAKAVKPVAPAAPVVSPEPKAEAPKPTAPVAPKASSFIIGQPDLGSKRLSQCELREYRIVPSQRASFKGYFIQGGSTRHDAVSNRDLFAVAVEIPHTDLAAAKAQLVTLRAEKARKEAKAAA
jgi:hypothetical protein